MFTNDETLLNNINIGSVVDYTQFLKQLRPLLLQESGFTEVADPAYEQGRARLLQQISQIEEQTVRAQQLAADPNTPQDVRLSEQKRVSDNNAALIELRQKFDTFDKTTPRTTLQKTPERLALEERFKKLEEEQLTLTEAQLQRQQKALRGEIPTSPILQKEIQDEFNTFKETQARKGNIILGDDPFSAVGKGTAAIQNLEAFQNNAKAAKQREIESIINQTPLTYGGFQLAQGATGQRAYAQPGFPDIGGLSQMSLASQQPFQFNRNLATQLQLARMGSKKSKSGVGTLLGGLAGAGIGGFLGGVPGAQLGLGIGGGFGSLF